jgi:hypothetical protein
MGLLSAAVLVVALRFTEGQADPHIASAHKVYKVEATSVSLIPIRPGTECCEPSKSTKLTFTVTSETEAKSRVLALAFLASTLLDASMLSAYLLKAVEAGARSRKILLLQQ